MITQAMSPHPASRPARAAYPPRLRNALLERAARIPFAGNATFWQSPDTHGRGMVCNLGQGQVMLRLGRFLAAGKPVYLQLHCLCHKGQPLDVTARVLWCRETREGDSLVALLQLVRDPSDPCTDAETDDGVTGGVAE